MYNFTAGKSSPSSVVTVNGDKRNLSARSASRSAENSKGPDVIYFILKCFNFVECLDDL